MVAYTVTAEFDDVSVAEHWIRWLRDEHLAEVLAGGALDAEVIRFDRDDAGVTRSDPASSEVASWSVRCEVRYHFASRAAFGDYERDHAPALRAKGLARFPTTRGIRYQRSLGEVAVFNGSITPPGSSPPRR
jgi:hypothetical protein